MSPLPTTVISSGEEVLYGRTCDTNAAYIARHLGLRGFRIRRHLTLGDAPERLCRELERCAEDSRVIVVSGGLGPTADDSTRGAIARAAGHPLVLDEDTRRFVERRLADFGRTVTPEQMAQARFPRGSVIFPNECGTARGFACRVGQAWLAALPGVPDEMRAMFDRHVLPFLLEQAPPAEHVRVETVHLFPVPEPDVDERLRDMTDQNRNPGLGITVTDGVITVSVTARADDPEGAEELLARDVRTLRERFGQLVFGTGDDTLAVALSRELEAADLTIGVAESLTGGLVGDMLVDVPGISRFFMGDVVAYSNRAKVTELAVPAQEIERHGAVSPQVARSMARGICRAMDTPLGVSTTGIAGPTGGSPQKPVGLVYVGVCLHGQTAVRELRLRGGRGCIKDRAAKHALNAARLAVLRGVGTVG